MIRVTPADVPDVRTFLEERPEYVMFPLNNLVRYGLDGDHTHSPRIWRNAGPKMTDLLGVTKSGMIMPYLPGGFEGIAQAITGQHIVGIVGPAAYARGVLFALGLQDVEMSLDADETHFSLNLGDLVLPEGTTAITPVTEDHFEVLIPWLIDYGVSTLGMSPEQAADDVPQRMQRDLDNVTRVVLMDGDTPVATTAFNAALPQIVQIGGVYTPQAQRGRGHARRAVALHLAQARATGVTRATLFAGNPSAIAACTAIGFKQIGEWTLAIFQTPQVAA